MAIVINANQAAAMASVTPMRVTGVLRLATGKMVNDEITPTELVDNPNCQLEDGSKVEYIIRGRYEYITPGDVDFTVTPSIIVDGREFTESEINILSQAKGRIISTYNLLNNRQDVSVQVDNTKILGFFEGDVAANIISNAGSITPSISTFVELHDTPLSYVGQSGKVVSVNSTEDGLEFITPAGGDSPFVATGTNSAVLKDSDIFNTTLENSVLIGEKCRGLNNNSLVLGGLQGGFGWNEQLSSSLTTLAGIGFSTPTTLADFLLPSGYYVAFECMVSGANTFDSYHQKVTGYAKNNGGTITLDYDVVDVKSESATMVITMTTTATGLEITGTINISGGGYRATTLMNLNYGKFGL